MSIVTIAPEIAFFPVFNCLAPTVLFAFFSATQQTLHVVKPLGVVAFDAGIE
jgi:hypothetical protein